jgi:hypothetical protein
VVEDAWRVLGIVNEWVRHAEAKAGLCLAGAGFVGGALFQLVSDSDRRDDRLVQALAATCALWVCAACLFAGLSLWPRLRDRATPASAIYFDHIARQHPRDGRAYVERLRTSLAEPDRVMTEVATQIWANARVARRKFRWAGLALLTMLLALATLGATAVIVII